MQGQQGQTGALGGRLQGEGDRTRQPAERIAELPRWQNILTPGRVGSPLTETGSRDNCTQHFQLLSFYQVLGCVVDSCTRYLAFRAHHSSTQTVQEHPTLTRLGPVAPWAPLPQLARFAPPWRRSFLSLPEVTRQEPTSCAWFQHLQGSRHDFPQVFAPITPSPLRPFLTSPF